MSRLRLPLFLSLVLATTISAQQPRLQPSPPIGRPVDPALTSVPTDGFMVVSVKAAKLWENPGLKPLRDWVLSQKSGDGLSDTILGLTAAEIDRVTLYVADFSPDSGPNPLLLVTTRKPYNEARVLKNLGVGQKEPMGKGSERVVEGRVVKIDGPFNRLVLLDEQTMLFLLEEDREDSGKAALVAALLNRKPDGPLAHALSSAHDHDVSIGLNIRGLRSLLGPTLTQKELVPYLSLLKAKTATLTVDLEKTAKGQLVLTFPDAETAKRAVPVFEEGMKALLEAMNNDKERPANPDPIEKSILAWGVSVLKNTTVSALGNNLIAVADVPYQDDLTRLVAVLPKELGDARSQAMAINNLKQLGLAMHNYHDAYGILPGDIGPIPKGIAWSWRVQVLPYIEQDNVYRQLDLSKPWDDPRNMKILEAIEMPKVFERPGRPAPKGHTYFRVLSLPKNAKGTDRPFFREGERGPKFVEITDGTSNTFLVVEAGEAVPWYKPDVLAYDGKLPLPQLGDKAADRFLALMGDGSVRVFRPSKLGEQTLRALITIQGGEVINLDK